MSSDASPRMPEAGAPDSAVPEPRRLSVVCLSVYPAAGPSVRHRVLGYEQAWRGMGIKVTLQAFLTSGLYRNRRRFGWPWTLYKAWHFAFCSARLAWRLAFLWRFDVAIIHREAFPLGSAWAERLAARINPRIVFDFDDAIWLRMPLAVDQRRLFWDADRVGDAIAACRAVVAGNTMLAGYARGFNSRVTIIPTPYLDLGGGANPAGHSDRVPVVVWIGNVGNEEYLDLIRTPLQRLAREIDFVFRIVGSAEATGFSIPGVKVETLEWREDREGEWLLGSAIGVMPLNDREYERGKCAFKLVQYFSAGLPVVSSPVGMNTEVVTHGVNGYLASGEEEWYHSLKLLLQSAELRRGMGAIGYSTFRERFGREKCAAQWMNVFRDVGGPSPRS